MDKYNHKQIEKKWQKVWQEQKPFKAIYPSTKKKFYPLVEFPYPSGEGLHTGHPRSYCAIDAIARKKRMEGFNVLYPIGWDAFGLPTENYAIKMSRPPQKITRENTDTFRRQLKSLGISFDWDREISTTDPKYYRWTQWIFLQLFKHGLAYKDSIAINWCPKCKIGLANEEVIQGNCERCDAMTEKRQKEQWMLAITKYADRLLADLETVDYLEKIKIQQRNWIGRSEGALIKFKIQNEKLKINGKIRNPKSKNIEEYLEVFTTRPDTLFGATFMVVAPEHPLTSNMEYGIWNMDEVKNYINQSIKKTDLERSDEKKEKTGVEIKGIKTINPTNGKEIPIFVADYVMMSYGTGAIMAVPAHDERDFEFAKKYNISIKEVVIPVFGDKKENEVSRKTVSAIIQRKSDNKFLMIHWKSYGWISQSIGGINSNETPEKAVVREVYEETGYKIKPITKLGGIIESHFDAIHKKELRERFDQPILCELVSDEPDKISDEEAKKHEVIWLTIDEFLKKSTFPYNNLGLERLISGNYSYCGEGRSVNSDFLDGLMTSKAKEKIIKWLEKNKFGKKSVSYKLRDWVFSRQHYWGEPIPIIYCRKCWESQKSKVKSQKYGRDYIKIQDEEYAIVTVPKNQLPVELPIVEKYQPTDTGESPLAQIKNWLNTTCPVCGSPAIRETDTMPNWAGSSWYYLRYIDPNNDRTLADPKKLKYWLPVDLYNGGMEHVTLHLLYSRFWHKFLFDIGAVPTKEPYQKRVSHGLILARDGRKMSKSRGNVVNPDEMVEKFGADAFRLYEMFLGPFDQVVKWQADGIRGTYRFLEKIWRISSHAGAYCNLPIQQDVQESAINNLIKKISADIDNLQFNTVVSSMMAFVNFLDKQEKISPSIWQKFLIILSLFAPHIAEELWSQSENNGLVCQQKWPEADKNKIIEDTIVYAIQVNGRLRGSLAVSTELTRDEITDQAKKLANVASYINSKDIKKIIFVKDKIINFVL